MTLSKYLNVFEEKIKQSLEKQIEEAKINSI